MKVRHGFVSNSSSSSFLIYGVEIDNSSDELGNLYHGDWDYVHYLGLSWDKIKNDETGAEFKARVVKTVNEALLKAGQEQKPAGSFGSASHAWYNG